MQELPLFSRYYNLKCLTLKSRSRYLGVNLAMVSFVGQWGLSKWYHSLVNRGLSKWYHSLVNRGLSKSIQLVLCIFAFVNTVSDIKKLKIFTFKMSVKFTKCNFRIYTIRSQISKSANGFHTFLRKLSPYQRCNIFQFFISKK